MTRPQPRGIRNNNPGNIRASDLFRWRGQDGADSDGFARFDLAVFGIRAMAILIRSYVEYHHVSCITSLIDRWDFADHIVRGDYAQVVAHECAVDPTAPCDLLDMRICLIRGMIRFENGVMPYSDDTIIAGVDLSKIR